MPRTRKGKAKTPAARDNHEAILTGAKKGANDDVSRDLDSTEIARCAYLLWEKDGREHGNDVDHWLEAEALLHRNQDTYDVILTAVGKSKIRLVREIRARTGLDLATVEALVKEMPQPIKLDIPKDDAQALLEALQALGGSLEIRPAELKSRGA